MSAETSTDRGLTEALGLIGSGAVSAFLRLAEDAQHAPDMRSTVTFARMAAGELGALDLVEQRARALGVDAEAAIEPFRGALQDFDDRTRPSDWWERVVKTYVGYGVIRDFQRELCAHVPARLQEHLETVASDSGYGDYVVALLSPVLEEDRQLAARLALWGRRVMGEALSAVRRLVAEHPLLLPEGTELSRLLAAVTARHAARMGRLGLTA